MAEDPTSAPEQEAGNFRGSFSEFVQHETSRHSTKEDTNNPFDNHEQGELKSTSQVFHDDGELIGTVHSRHSLKNADLPDLSQHVPVTDPSEYTTPVKDTEDTHDDWEEEDKYEEDTPSTAAPPSYRGSPMKPKKMFNVPEPIGHSVLCMSTYRNSPRHTFAPRHRQKAIPDSPGPGAYAHDGKPVGDKPSAHMVPRQEFSDKHKAPPPGTYQHKTCITDGKAYTMGYARSRAPPKVPDPGRYDPLEIPSQSHKYTFGSNQGHLIHKTLIHKAAKTTPGPGAYEHESPQAGKQGPMHTITGGEMREKPPRYEQRPGPMHYDLPTSIGQSQQFSHGVPRTRKVNSTPGPGHYGGHYSTFHLS